MNGVDVADQLRGSYWIDHWMKKMKWWWLIWMWGVQLLLVHTYVLYKSTHLLTWKRRKKTLLSQYEFWLQIALACLSRAEDTDGGDRVGSNKKHMHVDDSSSSSPCMKALRVNDVTLSPTIGALRARLDSDYHYPVYPEADRPCCSICCWSATSRDEKKGTMLYDVTDAMSPYALPVSSLFMP